MAGLRTYRRKRDFAKTPEPEGTSGREPEGRSSGDRGSGPAGGLYCIQKHAARQLHYDLRLELDGVLVSWAVPKGPSLDPRTKRLAVRVEDHPVEYGDFEGVIPAGEYGGGAVMLWDTGAWEPVGDPHEGLDQGELKFRVEGRRLHGGWALVHTGGRRGRAENEWLLVKERDGQARPGEPDAWGAEDRSVSTGRTMEEIAAGVPAAVPLSLATLVAAPPEGDDWVHEVKYDGYRVAARVDAAGARLFSRNGLDWTERFAGLAAALGSLPATGTWLDGELVAFDGRGVSGFGRLQRSLKDGRPGDLTYVVFDLLFQDGEDLRGLPLLERKRRLRRLLDRGGGELRAAVRYADHIDGRGAEVFEEACLQGLEGVVSKRAADPYAGRRTRSWLKSKCARRQEFVVGGFTEPTGSRAGLGALLVGVYDEEGALRYAGRVGAGFDARELRRLRARLNELERDTPPFADPPRGAQARGVHWATPGLVAEVRFSEWTGDGRLRQPVFEGLREDKRAAEVERERAAAQPGRKDASRAARVGGVAVTHPGRVVFPDPGLTKHDVADYYAAVAGLMVPYLERRALTVVRCPGGIGSECFFQKHVTPSVPKDVSRVRVKGADGAVTTYPVVDSGEALLAMVQNGAVEFHVWGSRVGSIETPDVLVFDLDPAPDVEWRRVREAARALRAELADRGLESFLRTSGGKGLHVVVPHSSRSRWPRAAGFAREIAETLVAREPDRYTATMSKARRGGKILVDHFRNGRGATSVAPYSLRARPGAPVALPIAWDELPRAGSGDAWDARRVLRRLRALGDDPWRDFWTVGARQQLPAGDG